MSAPSSAGGRASNFARRARQIAFALALAAFGVSFVAGLASAWRIWRRPPGIGIRWLALAQERQRAGESTAALAEYRAALAITWASAPTRLRLARMLRDAGDRRGALDVLATGQALGIEDADIDLQLGELLAADGRFDEAVTSVERAVHHFPDRPQGYLALGELQSHRRDFMAALDAYTEAVRLVPSLAEAHKGVGVAQVQLGRLDTALVELEEAVRLDPNLASAHNAIGVVYLNQRRYGDAREAFKRALVADVTFQPARENLEGVNRALATQAGS